MQLRWHHQFNSSHQDQFRPVNQNLQGKSSMNQDRSGEDEKKIDKEQEQKQSTVYVLCIKCGYKLGTLINRWKQITGSYYLPEYASSCNFTGLVAEGEGQPSQNAILEGCSLQSVRCGSCDERVAFKCLNPPAAKTAWKDREFFKLSLIVLQYRMDSLERVQPSVKSAIQEVRRSREQLQSSPTSMDGRRTSLNSNSGTTGISERQKPVNLDAEREAVDIFKKTKSWYQTHEAWERRTRRNLSPSAFGKHLMPYLPKELDGGGLLDEATSNKSQLSTPIISKPLENQPIAKGPSFHPANSVAQKPPTLPRQQSSTDSMHRQEVSFKPPPQPQISRTPQLPSQPPQTPSSSQQSQSIAVQNRQPTIPVVPSSQPDSFAAQRQDLDRVDFAVGRLQVEMHHLKLEMATIKSHILNKSGTGGDSDSATLDILSETVSNMASKTGEIDGLKLTIENLKRKIRRLEETAGQTTTPLQQRTSSVSGPTSAPVQSSQLVNSQSQQGLLNSNKRKFSHDIQGDSGAKYPRYSHSSPTIEQVPTQPNSSRRESSAGQEVKSYRHIIMQNAESQDSWRPESQRTGEPSHGRVGRPRKYPSPDLGTPEWEKEGWSNRDIDSDGYYHYGGPTSPASDRGRMVRRGSGGGLQQSENRNIRRRQKPVRNAEGVLIRKDGKPDQRSISSPMNLKKTHARKQMEQENSSSRSSPLATNITAESPETDGSKSPEPSNNGNHAQVMKQMFPNGIHDEPFSTPTLHELGEKSPEKKRAEAASSASKARVDDNGKEDEELEEQISSHEERAVADSSYVPSGRTEDSTVNGSKYEPSEETHVSTLRVEDSIEKARSGSLSDM